MSVSRTAEGVGVDNDGSFRRQSRPEGSEEILQEIAELAAVAAETELP
jgi:hypothetical protein